MSFVYSSQFFVNCHDFKISKLVTQVYKSKCKVYNEAFKPQVIIHSKPYCLMISLRLWAIRLLINGSTFILKKVMGQMSNVWIGTLRKAFWHLAAKIINSLLNFGIQDLGRR